MYYATQTLPIFINWNEKKNIVFYIYEFLEKWVAFRTIRFEEERFVT